MLTAEQKTTVLQSHRRDEKDSGSPEVQIAMLTTRIKQLTEHLRTHAKDHSSRRGLLGMVHRRNSLLKYLARVNRPAYQELITKLGLRK
jgi:small subunit ribosomal protein S15